MPIAATSRGRICARPSASTATPICVAQISPRVVLDPARLRKDLRELLLRDGDRCRRRGRRRSRASWWCPGRAQGCTARGSPEVGHGSPNMSRGWKSNRTRARRVWGCYILPQRIGHAARARHLRIHVKEDARRSARTAGRVSRHVRPDRLRRRRRRAGRAEQQRRRQPAADQHRLGPGGDDGVLRGGRRVGRASESGCDARARRPPRFPWRKVVPVHGRAARPARSPRRPSSSRPTTRR